MIRQYNNRTVQVENGVTKYLADIFCNSTDTKPTANLVNGSKLTEVDTGKTFLYDEGGSEWVEYSAGGGGGGGVCVTFTNLMPVSETEFTATASMTSTEIQTAALTGKHIYAILDLRTLGIGVGQLEMAGVANSAEFNLVKYTFYTSNSTFSVSQLLSVLVGDDGAATIRVFTPAS